MGLETATDNVSAVTGVAYNTTTHEYDTYDFFIHPHWKQFPIVPDSWHYAIGIYITIVGITGVLGNMLVIYMFSSTKNLRTPSNMFVVNLALSDMAFSAINGFPLLSISCFNKRWVFGNAACIMTGFTGGIFGIMSISTLAAISYDRYVCISNPLQAARFMTRRRAFTMITVVWMFSLVVTVPPIFGWGAYVAEGFQTSCTFDYVSKDPFVRSYIICLYIVGFVLPLTVIVLCYIFILKAVRKHADEMKKMAKKMNAVDIKTTKEKAGQELRIAKIAMMLISLFILSWTPYATVALIAQFGPSEWVTPYVAELPVMLAKASAMHNPLVYALSHPKFREALHKKMPWLLCCCKYTAPATSSAVYSRSRQTKVSRTVSGDSAGYGANSDSDVSSIVSNLDIDIPYPPIEMKSKSGRKHDKSSFQTASAMRNPDGSYTNQLVSSDLVKDLIGALVTVANNRTRDPVYLPTNPEGESSTRLTGNENVFVLDNGKQIDLRTIARSLGASDLLGSHDRTPSSSEGYNHGNKVNVSPGGHGNIKKHYAKDTPKSSKTQNADSDSNKKELLANEEENTV